MRKKKTKKECLKYPATKSLCRYFKHSFFLHSFGALTLCCIDCVVLITIIHTLYARLQQKKDIRLEYNNMMEHKNKKV